MFRNLFSVAGWKKLNKDTNNLMEECYAEATKETKSAQLEKYNKFCQEFKGFVTPFPCPSRQIALYISYLTRSLKYSSIKGYVSALSVYMKKMGFKEVDYNDYRVYSALRGARRTLGDNPKQAVPILPHHLIKLGKHLSPNQGHLAFRAALLLSFRALLRKQQVTDFTDATLTRSDVKMHEWGMMSKTIQFKQKVLHIPVSKVGDGRLCAVKWVTEHMIQSPAPPSSPLFIVPGPGGPTPMTYKMYQSTLKLTCGRAGLDPAEFSSHSMRSGGATFLGMIGAPLQEIKARGDWSSDCVLRYLRTPIDVRIQQDLMVAAILTSTAKRAPDECLLKLKSI